jgi:hypothetical protein
MPLRRSFSPLVGEGQGQHGGVVVVVLLVLVVLVELV